MKLVMEPKKPFWTEKLSALSHDPAKNRISKTKVKFREKPAT